MREEMKTNPAKMKTDDAEMLARIEAKTDANLKEIIAEMWAWQKKMMACQEETEACLKSKELTSVEIESVVLHEEVSKDATVKTLRALKEWYGDRHLAVGCRQQLKKWTQDDGGTQKLAAARRGMTRRAILALRRE
jgi:hypothetical protein